MGKLWDIKDRYKYVMSNEPSAQVRASVNYMPGSGRGLICGGRNSSAAKIDNIDMVHIPTLGNAVDFGNLTVATMNGGALSSTTRVLVGGGEVGSSTNVIQYLDMASLGNMADFGDLEAAKTAPSALSSSTRGVWGGYYPAANVIQYVTIASTGNSSDFGDLTSARYDAVGASSPTRGVFIGGSGSDVIDYITIASTGDATDFGDLTHACNSGTGGGNGVRAIIAGGFRNPGGGTAGTNIVEYITIATTGNATDFGDLTEARYGMAAVCSKTRLCTFAGLDASDNYEINIDYFTVASTGNASDFGDATASKVYICKMGGSDSHGGL